MFQLNSDEFESLRSQIATSKKRGGRQYLPHAFTEHGVIMLATILNTPVAIETSIIVVRAFNRLKDLARLQKQLAEKISEVEGKLEVHDGHIATLFDAINKLIAPPEVKKRRIGY